MHIHVQVVIYHLEFFWHLVVKISKNIGLRLQIEKMYVGHFGNQRKIMSFLKSKAPEIAIPMEVQLVSVCGSWLR